MILVCLHGPIKNNIISIDQLTLKVYLTMQKHLATHKKAAFTVSRKLARSVQTKTNELYYGDYDLSYKP